MLWVQYANTQFQGQHANSVIIVGSFRELGPPDLCHIIKVNAKPGIKEVCNLFFFCKLPVTQRQTLLRLEVIIISLVLMHLRQLH